MIVKDGKVVQSIQAAKEVQFAESLPHRTQEKPSKATGENASRHKAMLARHPSLAIERKAARRNEAVNVGMKFNRF